MNEDMEIKKIELQNANDLLDIKGNPVVDGVLLSFVKAIPIIGDMVDSSINSILEDFQNKKEKEFIDVILQKDNKITSEQVNDVEFIVNYARTLEAVKRLANNDKVKYYGNLICNGYLSEGKIQNDEFEEYVSILNDLSYREIQYLIFFAEYEKKSRQCLVHTGWSKFEEEFKKEFHVRNVYEIFERIKRTGFIIERFETEDGEVDNEQVSGLDIKGIGFEVSGDFQRFSRIVLEEIQSGELHSVQ